MRRRVAWAGLLAAVVLARPALALTLVAGGRSDYVVCLAADAPPSVKLAAAELQRVLKLSTGVELPIADSPAAKMICLGAQPAADRAGVTAAGLPDDGFRLRTVGESVYVVGKDYPGDKPPWTGWMSRGTLFGAYDFLERVVGVRWLLPGDEGEDVPSHDALTVSELALEDMPDFPVRGLFEVGPSEWLLRNKTTTFSDGYKLNHGHAWDAYLPEATLDEHPEWLALRDNGQRYRPPSYPHVKWCTSNPDLISAFAEGVIRWLEARPAVRGASLSPSDGGGFCQCDQCRKLVETDPHGRPSVTPLVLKFYNDVAKLVGARFPDRILSGYVYYNYLYPPTKPVPMEPNVRLVWAPLNYYGYGLMKPLYRDEFEAVVTGWLKVTPNFIYHNYSTWMRSFNGAPLPIAEAIQKMELPTLRRLGARGAEMVGIGAVGVGGPSNYLRMKMMWNAEVDVDAVLDDWFQRAYGPGWRSMREAYRRIDAAMIAHKEQETPIYFGAMYEVNATVAEKVYAPLFADLERLYYEALGKVATDRQRRRLEMYGANLVQLHWSLRQLGLLAQPEASKFYRTDEQYRQFMDDQGQWPALYRIRGRPYEKPIWKGEWSG